MQSVTSPYPQSPSDHLSLERLPTNSSPPWQIRLLGKCRLLAWCLPRHLRWDNRYATSSRMIRCWFHQCNGPRCLEKCKFLNWCLVSNFESQSKSRSVYHIIFHTNAHLFWRTNISQRKQISHHPISPTLLHPQQHNLTSTHPSFSSYRKETVPRSYILPQLRRRIHVKTSYSRLGVCSPDTLRGRRQWRCGWHV